MANSTVWERIQGDHPLQTPWAFWYDRKQNKKLTGARYFLISKQNFILLLIEIIN